MDPRLIQAAKKSEIEQLQTRQTYTVPQPHDEEAPGTIHLQTRWVIVNKGTTQKPNVRARLVARDFADKSMKDELFAGTPGIDVVRMLISDLATNNEEGSNMALIMDISSAFLYGDARRPVY